MIQALKNSLQELGNTKFGKNCAYVSTLHMQKTKKKIKKIGILPRRRQWNISGIHNPDPEVSIIVNLCTKIM